MAPSLEIRYEAPTNGNPLPSKAQNPSVSSYSRGRTVVEKHETYVYEDLKPSFPDKVWPALAEVPYSDKALLGDPTFKNLLANATDIFDYNPKIGTEIHGVDLANLSDAAKNDLALLIATRGVVFFRNQKNLDIDAQRKLGQYFGSLHKHATTSVPKRGDLDDVHVVYTDENSKDQRAIFAPTLLFLPLFFFGLVGINLIIFLESHGIVWLYASSAPCGQSLLSGREAVFGPGVKEPGRGFGGEVWFAGCE